jgi:hypothetical protein
MRPPLMRNFVGESDQIRPNFSAKPGPVPRPNQNSVSEDNKDSLMQQACIRGHETISMSLSENKKSYKIGDYSKKAPAPKLEIRSNTQKHSLVYTFE